MSTGRSVVAVLVIALLASCDAAEEVRVQPLPPLERPSPEARAGLPELAGVWRFAGWDLAPADSGNLGRDLPALGEIRLQTQRLDSLAGAYAAAAGGPIPLVGEVRRDSIVSLVAGAGPEGPYFLAGEYARDTLWIRISSLTEPGSWPSDALAAFVRTEVASRFVRLHGTTPAPPVDSAALLAADSAAAADSLRLAAAEAEPGDSLAPPITSTVSVPATAFLSRPGRNAFGFATRSAAPPAPTVAPPVLGEPARQPEPQPDVQAPAPVQPAPEPEPRPEPEPEPEPPVEPQPDSQPRLPRLLGEPVRPDTASTPPSPPAPPADLDW